MTDTTNTTAASGNTPPYIAYQVRSGKDKKKRRNKSAAGGGGKVQRPANKYPTHCGASTL